MSKTKEIALTSLLLALFIILNRFLSIKTPILIISFQYIPLIISAIYLGEKYSMVIGALGDFIGAIIFPFGPYFPGFTLNGALSGLIYGLLLHNKNKNLKLLLIYLIISSILVLVGINIFLSSLWLCILYGKSYWLILINRIATELIMIFLQVTSMYKIVKDLNPIFNKYLKEGR